MASKRRHFHSRKPRPRRVTKLVPAHRHIAAKSGLPPGSLVHVRDRLADSVRISVVTYDESQAQFKEDVQLQDLTKPREGETLWIVSGMLDIYLSSVSNKLNEIMKVLTIIATLFIPLTFVTGWYGMNFKTMPELDWRWGYPMVIAIALSVSGAMLITFRRRGWI